MTYLRPIPVRSKFFLPIPGHPHYEISLTGQVRNRRTGRILKNRVHCASCRWYRACSLGLIHRLLMSAILGHCLTRHEWVRHKNGNTFDNSPCNLQLGTPKQNAVDRIASNTNGRALKNQDVRDIRALADTLPLARLAARYRVSMQHIKAIIARRAWANLP